MARLGHQSLSQVIVFLKYKLHKKGKEMNRRDALKVAGLATLVATVAAEAKLPVDKTPVAQMNRTKMSPKDPKNMTKAELKHSPQITIKEKDAKGYTQVEITIGQEGIMHPSTKDHWIDFITLEADGTLVGKSTLEPEISRGAASFSVKLDTVKTLKATAGCNLHGIWTSTLKV